MKRNILITVIVLLNYFNAFAQYSFDWKSSDTEYQKSAIKSVVDASDNIIVTGDISLDKTYTRKYNTTGTLQWEVIAESNLNGTYLSPNWINCDANNNIYVLCNRYSFSSSNGRNYPNAIFIYKYNASGLKLWEYMLPINYMITQQTSFNTRSELDENGNLYVATSDDSLGIVLYQFDPSGNLMFIESSTDYLNFNFSSMRIKKSMIVLSSASNTFNAAPIFVWDTMGNFKWSAITEGRGTFDVDIDELGNVYVLSFLNNVISSVSGADINITKFNAAGNKLWKRDFDFGYIDYPSKMVYKNGRISVMGYGLKSTGSGYFDWQVFQTDTSGILLWNARYDSTSSNDEIPYSIYAKTTGEVILTGKGGPSPSSSNLSAIQMPVVQFSNMGIVNWVEFPDIYSSGIDLVTASDNSLYTISTHYMTINHYINLGLGYTSLLSNHNISILSNPFYYSTNVKIVVEKETEANIFISDNQGRIVKRLPKNNLIVGENLIELNLEELTAGIYFCTIHEGGSKNTFKLVKM